MTLPKSFSLKRITDLSGQGIKSIVVSEDIANSTTIILDNNELSDFKPLSTCAKLQKLSLVNNHILRIDGLSSLSRLQVLNIADNRIEKIEGLSNLTSLEWLNLSGNKIKVIGNLKSNILLKHLDLSRNSISELGDLSSLVHLKTFFIQGNKLKTLRDIPAHLPPSISTLSIADNQLEDLTEMQLLGSLPFLENLSINGNPCLSGKEAGEYIDYRPYVICCCKNLMNLDGVTVTQANKHTARVLDAEGHLKMLHPGEHSKLTKYLLEASPGYSSDTSKRSGKKLTKEEKRISSEGVNTSLLESESVYLPIIYESPPKKRKSNIPGLGNTEFRPSTAPPQFDLRGITWKDLIIADVNGNIPQQHTEISLDKKMNGTSNGSDLTMKTKQFPPKYGLSDADRIRPKTAPIIATLNDGYFQEEADIQDQTEANLQAEDVTLRKSITLAAAQSTAESAYYGIDDAHTTSISASSVSMTAEEALRLLHLAASMIQAYVRGFLQRKIYQRFLKKHRAALRIQAVWRGYYTRNLDMELISLKKDQNIQKLTHRVGIVEEELARVQVERRKDKVVIADIVTIMMYEINSQREKINSLVQAKKLEDQYRENVHGICIGLQAEICQLRSVLDQRLQSCPSEPPSLQSPHSKRNVITPRAEVSGKLKCSDLTTQPDTILLKPDSVGFETGVSRADRSVVGIDSSEQFVGRSCPIDTDSCEPTVSQAHPASTSEGVESRTEGGISRADRSNVGTDSSAKVFGRSRPVATDSLEPTVGQSYLVGADAHNQTVGSADVRYPDDDNSFIASHGGAKSHLELGMTVGSTDIESAGVSRTFSAPFETIENRVAVGSSITDKSHPTMSFKKTDESIPSENLSDLPVVSSQLPSRNEDLVSQKDATLVRNDRTKVSGDSFVPFKMDRDFPAAQDVRKTQLNETFIIGDRKGLRLEVDEGDSEETADVGDNGIGSVVSGVGTRKVADNPKMAKDDIRNGGDDNGQDLDVTRNGKYGPGVRRDNTETARGNIRKGGDDNGQDLDVTRNGKYGPGIGRGSTEMARGNIRMGVDGNGKDRIGTGLSKGGPGIGRESTKMAKDSMRKYDDGNDKDRNDPGNMIACTERGRDDTEKGGSGTRMDDANPTMTRPAGFRPASVASPSDQPPSAAKAAFIMERKAVVDSVAANDSDIEVETLRSWPKDLKHADWKPALLQNFVGGPKLMAKGSARDYSVKADGDKVENVEQENNINRGFNVDMETEPGVRMGLKDESKVVDGKTVGSCGKRTVLADQCDDTKETLTGQSAKAGRTEEADVKQDSTNEFSVQNDTRQVLGNAAEMEPPVPRDYTGRSDENGKLIPEAVKDTKGELVGRSVTRSIRDTFPSVPDNVSSTVLTRDLNIASDNLSSVFGKTKQRLKDIPDRRRTLFPSIITSKSESADSLSRSLTSSPTNAAESELQQEAASRAEDTEKFTQAPRKLFSPTEKFTQAPRKLFSPTEKLTQTPRKLFSPLGLCDPMSDLSDVAMLNRNPHIAPDDMFSTEKSVVSNLQIDEENTVLGTDVKSGSKGDLESNFEDRTQSSDNLNSSTLDSTVNDSLEPQTGHPTSGPAYSIGETGPVIVRNPETESDIITASGIDNITDDSTQDTLNEMSYESGSAASNVRTSTPVKEKKDRIEINPDSKNNDGKTTIVRTGTSENKDRIVSIPDITNSGSSAISSSQKMVFMSPSRALHEVPDCLSSMPLIVPQTREQKTPEVSKTLPMFIDQSFDSANTSFDI